MLQSGNNAPLGPVRGEGEAADQARIDSVAAITADRRTEPLARGGRGVDALQVVDDGIGGRSGTRGPAGLDDRGSPLLHGGQEFALQPGLVTNHLGHRLAADLGLIEIGVLRCAVVPPDREIRDRRDRLARLAGQ